jgi:hypothetical protein
MFANMNHFKKATQEVFKMLKAKPNLKLSEFRQNLVQTAGFNNLESYQASFKSINNVSESEDARIQAVSVIVQNEGLIEEKEDFKDNKQGNQQAEQLFSDRILQEYRSRNKVLPYEEEDYLADCLDNGYAEIGGFLITLIHSTQ